MSRILSRQFNNDSVGQLTVMQWNTLSDQLAIEFPRVDQQYLDWSYRWPLIAQEISEYNADLVCMEEVDHYQDYFLPFMQERGYEGIFHQKGGWHKDGTCIFYKASKLEFKDSKVLNFAGSSQFALFTQFTDKQTGQQFMAAATHLKAKKPFEQTRYEQVAQILAEIQNSYSNEAHKIVLGDFNTTPDLQSYEEMVSFGFSSAYFNMIIEGQEPQYTTYKYRTNLQSRTIDYIFLQGFQAVSVLNFPSEEQIGENALPSDQYPSDHLSLVAKLRFN